MEMDTLRALLGWAALINIGILLVWWAILIFAKDWMFSLHRRWFNLSDTQLNEQHYQLYGIYKLANILLFISPYLALRIIG